MATKVKLKPGNYRVQVRRKGQYASKTFLRKADAQVWAIEAERRTDQGFVIEAPIITGFNTFGQLIDPYSGPQRVSYLAILSRSRKLRNADKSRY